jgi:hypothetical protein
MSETITYTPPPTVKAFIKHYLPHKLFYNWVVGPVGSGKTTGIFFKLVHMASLQAKGPDGIRRSRAVVVRNTAPQLKDTTLKSWFTWFKDGQAGSWAETNKVFVLRFNDVECEVLFRPLDTADDVARVLSLELTFAIVDEFVQIPQEIIDALSARLGRYPAKKDGGATNWGMWGSSNTETEDNWWFEHLHDPTKCWALKPGEDIDVARARHILTHGIATDALPNAAYFLQPSGFAPEAENLDNLPGGAEYYTNQAQGKTEAWVKQFLEAEWGFSVRGKPVVPMFKETVHVSAKPLKYNPLLPLVGGLDPGIGGTALIFGQEDAYGRLLVLGELVTEGVGAQRFITDILKPYLRARFPNTQLIIAPDPAAANRAQTDERSVVDVYRKYFPIKIETNNQLSKRLDAIDYYAARLTEAGPALVVDKAACPILVRALKGGWKYRLDEKRSVLASPTPEKNKYSHPGDAFGYLSRYFHRMAERGERHQQRRQTTPRTGTAAPPQYHFR